MIRKNRKSITLGVLVLILAGCSMWQDFTTYFNRYYNAKEKFLEAEEVIKAEKKDLFQFRSEKVPPKAIKPLESVVEGCSKILQYNQESSYVNDALFLIGRAFYYEQKFLKADRKFAELYAIDNSEFHLESKLWLGKTKLQLREFEIGINFLDEVIDTAIVKEKDEVYLDALITKTSFFVFREDFENAITSSQKLLEVADDDEMKAEVAYEIGRLYNESENYEEALKYFDQVNNYSPDFEIEFSSQLEVARLKNKTGKIDESIDLLNDLKDESKYEQFVNEIDIELGVAYLDRGDYIKSLDILTEVDTTAKKTKAGGLAKYYKGVLYEKGLGRLDSALTYYRGSASSIAPIEIRDIAREKEKTISKYIKIRDEIDNYYTKFLYLEDSTRYTRDSLEFAKVWYNDSLDMVEKIEEQDFSTDKGKEAALKAIPNLLNKKYINKKPEKNTYTAGELNEMLSKAQFKMGNYFFNEILEADSAGLYFDNVMIYYPDSIKTPQLIYTLGSYYSSVGDTVRGDSLFNYIYENYSTELIANEAAKRINKPLYDFNNDPARDLYIAAEKKYDDGKFQEALIEFKNIYTNYSESSFAPKAMLATSFIYDEEIKDVDSVLAVYDSLSAKYPGTEYTKFVGPKKTIYKAHFKAIADSLAKLAQDSLSQLTSDSLNLTPTDSSLIKENLNLKTDSTEIKKGEKIKPDSASVKKTGKTKVDSTKLKKPKTKKDTTKTKKVIEKF